METCNEYEVQVHFVRGAVERHQIARTLATAALSTRIRQISMGAKFKELLLKPLKHVEIFTPLAYLSTTTSPLKYLVLIFGVKWSTSM